MRLLKTLINQKHSAKYGRARYNKRGYIDFHSQSSLFSFSPRPRSEKFGLTSFPLQVCNCFFEIDDTHIVHFVAWVCHAPNRLIIRVIPTLGPQRGRIPPRSSRPASLATNGSNGGRRYLSGASSGIDRQTNCLCRPVCLKLRSLID